MKLLFLIVLLISTKLTFGQKDSLNNKTYNEVALGTNVSPIFLSLFLKNKMGLYDRNFGPESFSYQYISPHFYYKFLLKNNQQFMKIGVGLPGYLINSKNSSYGSHLKKEMGLDFSSYFSWGKAKLNNKKIISFFINKELIAYFRSFQWSDGDKWSYGNSEGKLLRVGGGVSYGALIKLSKFIDLSIEQSFYMNYSYLHYNFKGERSYVEYIYKDSIAVVKTNYFEYTKSKHFVDFNFYKFLTLNFTFKLYGKEND